MTFRPRAAAGLLEARGITLSAGLSEEELTSTEARFDIAFSPDHRAFLRHCLPLGDRWYDWRADDPTPIQRALRAPVDGVLLHVASEDFWDSRWGQRPCEAELAIDVAGSHLANAPQLVPLYGHRFLPAAPAPADAPVLSVMASDVIYYGADLWSYFAKEFGTDKTPTRVTDVTYRVPFWAELAER